MSGIGGVSQKATIQSVSSFHISPVGSNKKIGVTCNLPLAPVPFDLSWKHTSDLPLTDPGFRQPSRIDILHRVEVFVDVLHHGRWIFSTELRCLLMYCIMASGVVLLALLQFSRLHSVGCSVVGLPHLQIPLLMCHFIVSSPVEMTLFNASRRLRRLFLINKGTNDSSQLRSKSFTNT